MSVGVVGVVGVERRIGESREGFVRVRVMRAMRGGKWPILGFRLWVQKRTSGAWTGATTVAGERLRSIFELVLGLLHVAKGGLVLVKSRVDQALVYMPYLVRRGYKCGLDMPRGSVSATCDNRQSRSAARSSVNRRGGLKRLNPPKSQIQLHARRHVSPEQHKITQPMI